MISQWNKKIVLILTPVLLVACAFMATQAGTTAPPTEGKPTETSAPAQTEVKLPEPSARARARGNLPESSTPAQAGSYVTIKVTEGTTTRTADLYLPAEYSNGSANTPLILSFHGYGGTGDSHGSMTGLDTLADENGLLVAYPDGQPIDPKDLKKGLHWDVDAGSPDVKFIRDLITKIKDLHYRVDSSRIYVTGISNGGGMTHRVGCDMADIVAAIAPVEGAYKVPGWDDCKPARPIPVMTFHGLPDPVVPFNGGPGTAVAAGHIFANVPDWVTAWAQRDACNMTPAESQINSHVTKKQYSQCHGNATVIFYIIDDNGHAWPGSSMPNASKAIDATKEIWSFFTQYTLPTP